MEEDTSETEDADSDFAKVEQNEGYENIANTIKNSVAILITQ